MSSTRVKFQYQALKTRALARLQEEVADAQLAVDTITDERKAEERRQQWRADQEKRLGDLAHRLSGDGDSVSDRELARFDIERMPDSGGYYERARAKDALRQHQHTLEHMKIKCETIVPDEDGTVSLTPAQLREFFGIA